MKDCGSNRKKELTLTKTQVGAAAEPNCTHVHLVFVCVYFIVAFCMCAHVLRLNEMVGRDDNFKLACNTHTGSHTRLSYRLQQLLSTTTIV